MSTELVRIPFHGSELQAMLRQGEGYLVVKRACEDLGIDEEPQRKKLQRQPWAVTSFMEAPGPDGKTYQMFCLHVDSVPMWLATIQTSRVRADRRELLIAYQKECARVLRDHFLGRALPQEQEALARRAADLAVQGMAAEMAQLRREHDALAQQVLGVRRAAADGAEQTRAAVIESGEMADHQAQARHNQMGQALQRAFLNLGTQDAEQAEEVLAALSEHGGLLQVISEDVHGTANVVTALRQVLAERREASEAGAVLARALQEVLGPAPEPEEPPPVLDTTQAAKLLGVPRNTLYGWIQEERRRPRDERPLLDCLADPGPLHGPYRLLMFDRELLLAYRERRRAAHQAAIEAARADEQRRREDAKDLLRVVVQRLVLGIDGGPAKGNA